ncbi:MAG: BBP7 family outer membrane beta-barrel protein [Planctomyces sp.]|nr:BBP7 family outer membrane beta-barrel protein [Planctomyces sp.]
MIAGACLSAGNVARAQGGYPYTPYPTLHPYATPQPYAGQPPQPQMLPQDSGFFYDFDSRVDLIIRETIRGTYMRLEYLNWDVQKPGRHLLGAPVDGVDNPRNPFIVQTPSGSIGVAESQSTDGVDFRDLNGIRGTIGIPLQDVTLEGNVWGLAPGSHRIQDPAFLRNNSAQFPRFIAVGLLSDGDVSSRVLLYDESFVADYDNDTWGSDINIYYHHWNASEGIAIQPLLGFRYLRYDERLNMRGVFNNSSGAIPGGIISDPAVSQIKASSMNSVYSLQTGFRSELRHRWFTVGFEPKIAFGANDFTSRVMTAHLRDFDDPNIVDGPFDVDDPPNALDPDPVRSSVSRLLFTPTLDLGVYASIPLSNWANLRVGYNFMLAGNIVRADRAIYYNDEGIANPPAVRARERTEAMWVQGLSVGGEIILP